jgi:hypothetical protein
MAGLLRFRTLFFYSSIASRVAGRSNLFQVADRLLHPILLFFSNETNLVILLSGVQQGIRNDDEGA